MLLALGLYVVSALGSSTLPHNTTNLIPDVRVSAPLYWCTWQAQGRIWMSKGSGLSHADTIKYWEARSHKDFMSGSNSTYIFRNDTEAGTTGWAYLYPRVRKDLFFMLDNGWQDGDEGASRQLVLDTEKYPEFVASNPTLSLKLLNERIMAEGWRGLGVWVNGGGKIDAAGFTRLKEAGVNLLKFDGGDPNCEMTTLAREYAPNLIVEHGSCVNGCPLNGYPGDGRVSDADAKRMASIMDCSDGFRTYDTVKVFSVAETLDRQTKMLWFGRSKNGSSLRHFGGSGEPVVTAALGGTIQPMRSNLRGQAMAKEFMVYASGPRQRQKREDEITRLVNWAKIAPPFGGGVQRVSGLPDQVHMSTEVLFDTWTFSETDDAAVISHNLSNKTVHQGAPARVTRGGISLPTVQASQCDGCQPWVICTRFPNNATSIATIGRTQPAGFIEAKANVTVELGLPVSSTLVVGVFGFYDSLHLIFVNDAQSSAASLPYHVWAQDLTGAQPALDISDEVHWMENKLHLSGTLIDRVGTSGQSLKDDISSPGLVLRFADAIRIGKPSVAVWV